MTWARAAASSARVVAMGMRRMRERGMPAVSAVCLISSQSLSWAMTNLNHALPVAAKAASVSGTSARPVRLPECESLGETFH